MPGLREQGAEMWRGTAIVFNLVPGEARFRTEYLWAHTLDDLIGPLLVARALAAALRGNGNLM